MSSMIKNDIFNIKETKHHKDGNEYKVIIKLPDSGWIDEINFNVNIGNETIDFPMKHIKHDGKFNHFETNIYLDTRAIYRYYFSYVINNKTYYVNKDNINEINKDNMFKMSVNFKTPDWAKGKVMYHIFVDRFKRGSKEELTPLPRRVIHSSWDKPIITGPDKDGIWNNDFYGGDLKGIENSLDYIKDLGVSIIYLSPIVHSQSNHRYDTADYENVDPYVGSNEDLKSLCDKAHEKGMKIVLDAVFNHTGNDSKYFNQYESFDCKGAYQCFESEYSSFYRKYYDNGQLKYDYWWGMDNMPVCDGNSKAWQDYILGEDGVIDKWFDLGIDGLRLDVADELSDEFIEKIRIAVKRNKEDGFVIGEVWKNPMQMNRGYIESGKGMDTVMNYSLIDALIKYFKYADTNTLSCILKDILRDYPTDTINTLMNFTSTHDITRAINLFATNDFQNGGYGEWSWNTASTDLEWLKKYKLSEEEYKQGKEIYKNYLFALTFLPGILSIFYGDEIGMQGMGNLENRKPFTWDSMDLELLEYIKTIGKIRKYEKFLEEAELNIIDIDKNILLFERIKLEEKMLIAINRSNEERKLYIPEEYQNSNKVYTLKKSLNNKLSPHSGIAIKK